MNKKLTNIIVFVKIGGLWPLISTSTFMAILILPLVIIIYDSFTTTRFREFVGFTLTNYLIAFNLRDILPLLQNTAIFAFGSALLGTSLGVVLAWIVARTDTPGRVVVELLPLYPVLMPPIAKNIAWIVLLAPTSGVLNNLLRDWFGFDAELFNAFSMPAMVWVFGLTLVPLTYLFTLPVFLRFDPSFEESAYVAGEGPLKTSIKITFPLVIPMILSVFLLNLLRAVKSFATPALQGMPAGIHVFMTKIYDAVALNQNPGLGAAYSGILLLITITLVLIYIRVTRFSEKFAIITGKGYRSKRISIGRWRYLTLAIVVFYFLVGIFIPFITLLIMAFIPFYNYDSFINFAKHLTFNNFLNAMNHPSFVSGFYNSIYLALAAGAIAVLASTIMAYVIHRSKVALTKSFEVVGAMPLSFPGMLLGLGILLLLIETPLYQTPWALLLALLVTYFPYALRNASGSLINIHKELDEAAWVHGAKWGRVFARIVLPLLRGSMIAGFFYIFMESMRNIEAVILLSSPGAEYGPVAIFEYFELGRWTEAAAGSVIYLAVLWTTVGLARYVFKVRFGLGE
jgi:iron(III) transport system permease protein